MPQLLFLHKAFFFSSLCALLICLSNLTACSADAQAGQTSNSASSRTLPAEQPEDFRHSQTIKPQQARTTTNPWGLALDEARGFVYVAEPGCEMSPDCKNPQTQQRVAFPTK